MIYDFHTHSINSDGFGTVDELCGFAIEKGIAGFALTDHADMEYYEERDTYNRIKKSIADALEAKEKYAGKLEVYTGVELGGDLADPEKAKELLSTAARLGSDGAKRELSRILEAKKKKLISSLYSKAMRLIKQKKFETAGEFLELCVKLSHEKGIYTLGCLNEFGLLQNADRRRAYSLYELARSLGFDDPRSSYKEKFLKLIR